MKLIAFHLLLALFAAAPENLIKNPGFETLSAARPLDWEVFVAPAEGAFAKYTDKAHTGKNAVMLHTPLPYAQDPMNNWSQHIPGDFAEKPMRLQGFIRAQDATEAAIWIQCWRKQPWGVLAAYSTATDSPVYGDTAWRAVALDFTPPKDTDFLIVRAVLKGIGTAYFDDFSLAVIEAPPEKEGAAPVEKPPEPPQAAPKTQPLDAIGAEIARMRDANLALAEALQGLRDQNQDLRRELRRIQDQLRLLQAQPQTDSAAPHAETPPVKEEAAPPPWRPHQDYRSIRP